MITKPAESDLGGVCCAELRVRTGLRSVELDYSRTSEVNVFTPVVLYRGCDSSPDVPSNPAPRATSAHRWAGERPPAAPPAI
jgi:hypothetical protein